jgi:hypothetical protein
VLSGLQPNTRYHYRVTGEDAAGNAGQSGDRTFTTASAAPAGKQTVTFDDRAGQDQPLDGEYPSGVIDWEAGKWWHAGAVGKLATKSVSFSGEQATSESFHFVTPRKLVSLQAYNRGGAKTMLTLSCAGNPTRTAKLPAGKASKVKLRWADACDAVTLSSSNGRDTGFDNLRLR